MLRKISTRLAAGFGLLLLLLLLVIGIGLNSVQNLSDNSQHILQTEVQTGNTAQEIRYLVTRLRQKEKSLFISTGKPKETATLKQEWDELMTDLEKTVAHLNTLPLQGEIKTIQSKMPDQVKAYRSAMNTVYKEIEAEKYSNPYDADLALIPFKQPIRDLSESVKQISALSAAATIEASAEIDKDAARNRNQLLTLSLLAVLIGTVAAWAIARSIIQPIHAMRDEIINIDKNNDLTRHLSQSNNEELNIIVSAMNRLIDTLSGTMGQLQQQSRSLKSSAGELSTASAQVKHGSEQQADESAAMAAALEEISTSISHIANLSGDARSLSQQSGDAASQGARQIQNMVQDIGQISEAIGLSARLAEQLDESSAKISSITVVIKDVADQTNLLALNAAIEAARAGEQGRGFAVVADEVRKLAETTGRSAQEISAMIASIQKDAKTMAVQMQSSVSRVEAGMLVARTAGESIEAISAGTATVQQVIADVNVALSEQSLASQSLASKVEQIVQMIDENSRSTAVVAHTALQLDSLSDEMNQHIARYKV
ncbi:MAG: methyl-accepting chemotaxis protein [Iodobacter sp.]